MNELPLYFSSIDSFDLTDAEETAMYHLNLEKSPVGRGSGIAIAHDYRGDTVLKQIILNIFGDSDGGTVTFAVFEVDMQQYLFSDITLGCVLTVYGKSV